MLSSVMPRHKPRRQSTVVAQRSGAPTYDVIVELRRGARSEWRIEVDAGDAVDRELERKQYPSQLRIRDPHWIHPSRAGEGVGI